MPDIPTDSNFVEHYKYLDSNSAVLHDQHILFVAIPSLLVKESDLEVWYATDNWFNVIV